MVDSSYYRSIALDEYRLVWKDRISQQAGGIALYSKHAWRSALGHNLSHLRIYRSRLEADQ